MSPVLIEDPVRHIDLPSSVKPDRQADTWRQAEFLHRLSIGPQPAFKAWREKKDVPSANPAPVVF